MGLGAEGARKSARTGRWLYPISLSCRKAKSSPFSAAPGIHFRFPYGVFNPISAGLPTDLDAHLDTGSTVGLRRVDKLFPELQEALKLT